MTSKTYAALFGLGILAIGLLGYFSLPPRVVKPPGQAERQQLTGFYLSRVLFTDDAFADIESFMDGYAERKGNLYRVAEALAVFYGTEGRREKAIDCIAKIDKGTYDPTILRFALNLDDPLPEDWRDKVADDWVGARMSTLIYKRLSDNESWAGAQLNLRQKESSIRLAYTIGTYRHFLSMIGLGLLISLFLSNRHWKRFGKPFFLLTPLKFAPEVIYRFCLSFLAGLLGISLLLKAVSGGWPIWLQEVVSSLLYMAWGVWLIMKQTFRDVPEKAAKMLGISNLKMRPLSFIQILGGFAMVVACHYYGELIADLIGWPSDRINQEAKFGVIAGDPMARAVYGITACILAPFFEEVLFRGLVFRVLLGHVRPWMALWGSALVFTIMHPFALWPLILAKGFALAVIYYRTANLLVVVWTHALWNMAILILSLNTLGV